LYLLIPIGLLSFPQLVRTDGLPTAMYWNDSKLLISGEKIKIFFEPTEFFPYKKKKSVSPRQISPWSKADIFFSVKLAVFPFFNT